MAEEQQLRICTAFDVCPITECHRRVPHVCNDTGYHRFDTCYESKLLSASVPITDGSIRAARDVRCDCCGHVRQEEYRKPVDMTKCETEPTFVPAAKQTS